MSNAYIAHSILKAAILRSVFVLGLSYLHHRSFWQLSVNHVEFAKKKEAELDRKGTFLEAYFAEIRDTILRLVENLKIISRVEVSRKINVELQNSLNAVELLLHCADNYIERGVGMICDFDVSPTYTQIFSSVEKTWSLVSEILKAKGLKGSIRMETKFPKVLKIDSYRFFQIMMNLFGHSLRTSRRGNITMSIKWLEGASEVNNDSFEPIPYDEDRVYEKDLMIEALNRRKYEEDYNKLTHENKKFDEKLILEAQRASRGVIKLIYTDTGCDSWNSIPFDRFSCINSDEFAMAKTKKSLGLYISKQVCIRMKGDLRAYMKPGKGLTFVVCFPVRD